MIKTLVRACMRVKRLVLDFIDRKSFDLAELQSSDGRLCGKFTKPTLPKKKNVVQINVINLILLLNIPEKISWTFSSFFLSNNSVNSVWCLSPSRVFSFFFREVNRLTVSIGSTLFALKTPSEAMFQSGYWFFWGHAPWGAPLNSIKTRCPLLSLCWVPQWEINLRWGEHWSPRSWEQGMMRCCSFFLNFRTIFHVCVFLLLNSFCWNVLFRS